MVGVGVGVTGLCTGASEGLVWWRHFGVTMMVIVVVMVMVLVLMMKMLEVMVIGEVVVSIVKLKKGESNLSVARLIRKQ